MQIAVTDLPEILAKIPDKLPENLKTCGESTRSSRKIHQKLTSHELFDNEQEWKMVRKKSTKDGRCSGCLKKGAIKEDLLHLAVNGLLYLRNKDKVVETTLRFCPRRSCVTQIKGTLNNIKDLKDTDTVQCTTEFYATLNEEERQLLDNENINVSPV